MNQNTDWKPDDRFYGDYSFAVNFGYSSLDEFRKIKLLLKSKNYPDDTETVRISMEFVRDIANLSKTICKQQISRINKKSNESKIVGGLIPIDIFSAYEFLKFFLEAASLGIGAIKLGQYLKSTKKNSRSDENKKSLDQDLHELMEKIVEDKKANEVIISYEKNLQLSVGKKKIKIEKQQRVKASVKGNEKSRRKK